MADGFGRKIQDIQLRVDWSNSRAPMESLFLFTDFVALLNRRSEDAELVQLLDSIGVQRRPMKPTFFKSPFAVPFRVSNLGLLLYFED